MDWEAVGSIGEIIGAVGVIITLLYVAVQVRHNTATAAAATYDSLMNSFTAVNGLVIADPAVAELFQRGTEDPTSLTEVEAIQYAFLMRSWANQWLKIWRLRESGVISEKVWRPIAEEAAGAFATPGGKLFRKENQLFADLYQVLDRYSNPGISSVQLGASLQRGDDV